MEPWSKTAYSRDKVFLWSKCGLAKHCRYVALDTASRSQQALDCHVCKGGRSQYEGVLYGLLNSEPLIELYAVETFSLVSSGQIKLPTGREFTCGRKPWDAMTVSPPNLLIEVQGEQHAHKHDTRANNRDHHLGERRHLDAAMAEAAVAAGFTVLWLCVEEGADVATGHATKWAVALRQAVKHVIAGHNPKLLIA